MGFTSEGKILVMNGLFFYGCGYGMGMISENINRKSVSILGHKNVDLV